MAKIEERIVAMKFDNRGFSEGVRSTMSMLDRLKSALSFRGGSAGIDEAQAAVNKFSPQGMIAAIQNVSSEFSVLGMTAANVLGNVITGALHKAMSVLDQFTTAPIRDGFAEYELNMGSIQTILTNTEAKGSTLKDVTAALDELNTYADKTIYSFSEMTKNIGTFTAAGVGLKESTTAIKGISNLAAASGSNTQQAATAMYQMSQALAAGKVGLQDWNSLVNAGMGGELMQKALIETSRALGTGADAQIEKNGSFRESLKDGWLTAKVLQQTFENFSGDATEESLAAAGFSPEQIEQIQKSAESALQAATVAKTFSDAMDAAKESVGSGWAQTWQIVMGDFEEAKDMWTVFSNELSGILTATGDARNAILKDWKELGGRTELLDTIGDAYKGLKNTIGKTFEGFKSQLPGLDGKTLYDITVAIHKFTKALFDNSMDIIGWTKLGHGLGSVAKGILNVLKGLGDMAATAFRGLANGFSVFKSDNIFGMSSFAYALFNIGNGLSYIGRRIGDVGDFFHSVATQINMFDAFASAGRAIASSWQVVIGIFKVVGAVFSGFFGNLEARGEGPIGMFEAFFRIIEKVSIAITKFNRHLLETGGPLEAAQKAAHNFGKALATGFQALPFDKVFNAFKALAGIIGDFFGGLDYAGIGKAFKNIFDRISDSLEVLAKGFYGFFKFLIPSWDNFEGIAKGTADIMRALADVLRTLIAGAADLLTKMFSGDNFKNALSVITTIATVWQAKLMKDLAGRGSALEQIRQLLFGDEEEVGLVRGMFRNLFPKREEIEKQTGFLGEIVEGVTDTFGKMQETLRAAALMEIAIAIGIFTLSVMALTTVNPGDLAKSLAAISAMMGELVGMLYLMSKFMGTGFSLTLPLVAAGLIGLAIAIGLLSLSLKLIATMSWEELLKGLTGLTVVLGELVLFAKLIQGSTKGMITAGVGIAALAGGIFILSVALKILATMSWEEMARGLVGLAGVLAAIALFQKLTQANKAGIASATGILLLSGALLVLSLALRSMGSMSMETIGTGIVAIAESLLVIGAAMTLMPKGMNAKAVALIAISVALNILSLALASMGGMSMENIGKAILALAGGLGVLAIALNVMNGTAGGTLALLAATAALTLFVPVLTALGLLPWGVVAAGLGALAISFGIIAAAGYLMTPILPTLFGIVATLMAFSVAAVAMAAAGVVLVGVLTALAGIMAVLATVGAGIGTFIAEAIKGFVNGLIDASKEVLKNFEDLRNVFVGLMTALVTSVLQILIDSLPKAMELIGMVLQGIIDLLFKFTPQILRWIGETLIQLSVQIVNFIPHFKKVIVTLIANFLMVIRELTPQIVDTMLVLIDNLIRAIVDSVQMFIDGARRIINAFLDGIAGMVSDIINKGTDIIVALVRGIGDSSIKVVRAAAETLLSFLNGLAQAIRDYSGKIREAAGNIAGALIDGITGGLAGGVGKVMNKVGEVAGGIVDGFKGLLGIHSPSRVMRDLAGFVGDGIALGLDDSQSQVFKASEALGESSVEGAMRGINSMVISSDMKLSPTIRPVVDLSEVRKGAEETKRIFGNPQLSGPAPMQAPQLVGVSTMPVIGRYQDHFPQKNTTINFTQNNNSPEALSAAEIFRQTHSELMMLRKAI